MLIRQDNLQLRVFFGSVRFGLGFVDDKERDVVKQVQN